METVLAILMALGIFLVGPFLFALTIVGCLDLADRLVNRLVKRGTESVRTLGRTV